MGNNESTQPIYQSDDIIKRIQNIINELQKVTIDDSFMVEPIKNIKAMLKVFDVTPKNFLEYQDIVNIHCKLIDLLDSLRAEIINYEQNGQELLILLDSLKNFANYVAYPKRIAFMESTLNDPKKGEILFCNTCTEESIKIRYKIIILNFHPDKTNVLNIPCELKPKYINLGIEVFNYATDFLKNKLTQPGPSTNGAQILYEERAEKFWKIAIDYRNAHKGQWQKLKLLEGGKLKDMPSELLKENSITYGQLAYRKYRKACKLADSNEQLENQIKLRGYLALSQYISYEFTCAQLCALAAINLVNKYNTKLSLQDIYEAKKIFDKVRSRDPRETDTTQLNTLIIPENNSHSSGHDSVKRESFVDKLSFLEKKATTHQIKVDLEKISRDLVLEPDRSLIRLLANEKDILHAKLKAKRCNALGIAVQGVGGVLGLGAVSSGAFIALSNVVLPAVTIATGIGIGAVTGGAVLGVGLITVGIYFGRRLILKGKEIYRMPEIREKINQIMENAITAYCNRNYQKFLDVLFKENNEQNNEQNSEQNESLITLFKSINVLQPYDSIDYKDIRKVLNDYGYRPDGIAYLLLLIGDVLLSGCGKLLGDSIVDSFCKGRAFTEGILDGYLQRKAKDLDNKIQVLGAKAWVGCRYMWKFIRRQDCKRIAMEYEDAQNRKIFASKLNEICNIARINLAMSYVIESNKEALQKAKTLIEKVGSSTSIHHQYGDIINTRLEILQDLFWTISGEQANFKNNLPIED